jgi:predicted GIY-YIG superfamily endonuclease
MYYVYILKSLGLKDKIYIGYTSDLKKRLPQKPLSATVKNLHFRLVISYEAFDA